MDTKNWKWFYVSELFEKPYKGLAYNAKDLTPCSFNHENAVRYVTRTDTNNGLKGFVINENFENIEKGNAITIGDTTSTIYYQSNNFICGDHIVVLRSKHLNKIRGLFIISLLSGERYRYNYGRAFKKELIENTKIKLPVNSENNPDWQWIENYVNNVLIPKLPTKSKSIWEERYNSKPIVNNRLKLNTETWRWFRYGELFKICKGKRLTKADMVVGNIPYIGAIDSNNGISAYISNDEHIHSANTITVSYNGSIAEAYYQSKPFWATDDVNVLYPKFELNVYIALFLATIINGEKYRFNYGRKWDKELMEQSLIKLPAIQKANGEYELDWQFMEDYIKSLPYSACL